jgi:hypothetical protein
MWVVAQLAELRTVTAAVEGSTPFDPPKSYKYKKENLKMTYKNRTVMEVTTMK